MTLPEPNHNQSSVQGPSKAKKSTSRKSRKYLLRRSHRWNTRGELINQIKCQLLDAHQFSRGWLSSDLFCSDISFITQLGGLV